MSLTKKQKFSLMTALAFIMFFVAATMLRGGGATNRTAVLGWGFIMLFSCMTFVRGIFAIRRCK